MSTHERMPIPVKKSPKSNDKFVTYVMLLVANFTGSTTFTSPNPTLASLTAKANALAAANAKARGKGPGLVADRDAKRQDLEGDVDKLVTYVRDTIRSLGVDAATAIALVLGTGLSIRKVGRAAKPPLEVRHGSLSGEVLLIALALGRDTVFYWEYSLDQKTWTSGGETLQAKTRISGLTPGQLYYFRFHARNRKGLGPDSDAVKCIVI